MDGSGGRRRRRRLASGWGASVRFVRAAGRSSPMARPNSVRRLERAGIAHHLHRVSEDATGGEAMAAALGVDPALVLRTLVCEV